MMRKESDELPDEVPFIDLPYRQFKEFVQIEKVNRRNVELEARP